MYWHCPLMIDMLSFIDANISSRELMLKWLQALLPSRHITNLKTDWENGQNLLHLIHEIKPDKIPPVNSLDPRKAVSNCKLAIRTAKTHLQVPMIIDPEMLANGSLDEMSLMTYLSYFVKPAAKSILRLVKNSLPNLKIENLTTDWNNGIAFAALLNHHFPGSFSKWKDLPHNNRERNLEKVAESALKWCDIRPPVKPEHMSSDNVDEISIMTFVLQIIFASFSVKPEKVEVSGPGLTKAGCGRNTYFIVDYTKSLAGDLFVTVKHSNEPNMKILSSAKSHGIVKYSYTPKKPGKITVSVTLSDLPVPGSPFSFGVSDTSVIHIVNLENLVTDIDLGETFEVQIDASAMKESGNLTSRLVYQSHPPSEPSISTNGNGLYTVQVPMLYIGSPILHFYWNKEEIKNCAIHCTVVDIRNYCIVQASHKSSYSTFETVEFYVEASENLSFDPLKVVATSNGIHIPIQFDYVKDNQAHAEFTPTLPGVYSIHVTCFGTEIEESPFSIFVIDPSKCVLVSKPPKYLALHQNFNFVVDTTDAGMGEIKFNAENSSMFSVNVMETKQSEYTIAVEPLSVGETVASITHYGTNIPGSPFRLSVCDPYSCVMVGDVVDTQMCAAGNPLDVTIKSGTSSSNIRPVVKVHGPTARYPVKLTSVGNGDFSAMFTPWETGEHHMDITYGGFHIPNSPLTFSTDRTATEHFSASGEGLQTAYSGVPAQFIVFGNKTGLMEANGIEIRIQNMLGASRSKVRARDNNDGTYNVAYLTDQHGSYLIYISVCGRSVPGSPFRVSILPGPQSAKCKIHGKVLDPNTMFKIGEPIEFQVDTSHAGTAKLDVNAVGARGIQARVFIAPKNHKGIQDIQIDPSKPGKYRVSVKWGRKHVPHSPFIVKVFPGADPSKCKAHGPGIESSIQHQISRFLIETRDAGSGTLNVVMSGGQKIYVKPVSSIDVRTLQAEYCPSKAGDHLISIKWADKDISGSPFRIKVAPSSIESSRLKKPLFDIQEEEEEMMSMDNVNIDSEYVTSESNLETTAMPSKFSTNTKGAGGYKRQFETNKDRKKQQEQERKKKNKKTKEKKKSSKRR